MTLQADQKSLKDSLASTRPTGITGAPPPATPLDNVVAAGNMTNQQIADRSMEGVDKAGTPPSAQQMELQAAHLGGNVDRGMMDAIAQRQGKLYNADITRLRDLAQIRAPMMAAKQQGAALRGLSEQTQLENQAINNQMIKEQNDLAHRNMVLNSILGLGGGIAGAIAGGPGGAAAGSQLGGAAGTMVGGPQMPTQAQNTGGNPTGYFGGGE